MQHHPPRQQLRENIGRWHGGVQLILTRMNSPVRRVRFTQQHEGRPALDQPLALEQRRDILKGGSFRDDHDF